MSFKIESLIPSGSNIDAHLIDDDGYCVVVGVGWNEVYNYLIEEMGYDKEDVYTNLSTSAEFYKDEIENMLKDSTLWSIAIDMEFLEARAIHAQQEQQLRVQEIDGIISTEGSI
jgi:hypothetical protein